MRTLISLLAFLALSPAAARAQPAAGAPTRAASPSTPEQNAVVEAGARLHDQGKYDEAIAKYQEVLEQSPDNMTALYELAYSLAEKKDFAKSLEAATRGTQYRSELLPMFYDLIGAALDSQGQPQQAVEAYQKGLQIVPDASMLYYNMAITYLESLKNPDEARQALKKAAALDPTQPAVQLMLGQVFQTGGYRTAALLAFSRYLILEPTGPRALSAYGFWRAILRGGIETPQNGAAVPAMRDGAGPPASKVDEGDFADFEAQIPVSQRVVISEMDNGSEEMPSFLAHVNRLYGLLAARPPARDASTFVGTYYLPFFRELKEKNFVEPFVYWAIQRAPVPGTREWIAANQPRVQAFLAWANAYSWP